MTELLNTCLATTGDLRLLALYSHLIPAIAALILGVFAYTKATDSIKGSIFFAFTVGFSTWLVGDLLVWTSNDYHLVAAAWSPLDFIETAFFAILTYFVCYDERVSGGRRVTEIALYLLTLVPLFITLTGNSVHEMNQPQCEMIDNDFLAHYKLVVEGIMMLVVAGIASMRIFSRTTDSAERMRIAFTDVSVLLFMAFFAGSEFFATSTDIYEINLYALLALPIFILSLTVAITSYGTMRLGDSAVKVLFYIFLILASTQFFYVNSLSDFFLTLMSFFVIVILGLLLFRSNEREIASRHKVEELATDLQSSNERQEGLIHFISHEVKGALGKTVNVYSMTLEGDYGALPEKMQPLFTQGLHDTREAVDMVTAILLSSNLKSGQMKFDMKPFDMREATESVVNSLLPDAQRKGLTLSMHIPAGEYKINGDREIITKHVIRNLVDNSIRYTPAGSVTVSVARRPGVIVLSVEDTGVGISDEDKARLFTEGGRGKESVKVNVNSTGYGLFFAKQLIDAHKGTVRAESDGPGKGSRFVVELPAL